jgi:Ca-activated chloride channel family protein
MVSAPPLLGHVMTRHRPSAEQILTTPAGDPLLSWWRFGLGMSAAFTSDASSRWAANWVSWEHYSRFWSQVVRHCIQNGEPTGLATSVTDNGLLSTIKVIAVDRDDGFLNRAEIQIRVVDPDGRSATYQAGQTAPGEYQVQVEMRTPGAWQYHVTTAVGGITRSETSHAHIVGYSEEFRQHEVNVDLLRTIALSTGGQYAPNAGDVFQQSADQFVVTSRSVDDYLTLAVLLLFVLDVALQRVRLRSRTANG